MDKRAPISLKNASLLQALRYLKKRERNIILRNADYSLIKCICECALNTLKGNIALNKNQKQHLRQYVNCLRKLASNQGTLTSKKKIIVQNGGFLGPLLSVVASIITSIIAAEKK